MKNFNRYKYGTYTDKNGRRVVVAISRHAGKVVKGVAKCSTEDTDDFEKGKELVDKYIRKKGYEPKELLKGSYIKRALKELHYDNEDEFYSHLSHGGSTLSRITGVLIKYHDEDEKKKKTEKDKGVEV